ncbi:Indole-3-glycerol phosphate synthase [Corynebacterium occultum]|uniref:indole-3-glycerol-phosphate synthase n=1 Tax=Corynebacterium occultum TaxID=2675219 RepID=A0A6B8WA74_9CORY|nr:indole-3-glycerol phosphate synthase TrpC [Corynebacterium occultum]QGU07746.1 Indole-3-glycerol phosphate synthase [Corynebacterium occultum]
MNAAAHVERILAEVTQDVAAREAVVPFKEIKALSRSVDPARDAVSALLSRGCGVIAEIKRAIPGRGPIAEVASIPDLAREFEKGGASLIACHTDRLYHQGSLSDMAAAHDAVSVPIICRDLIVDPYQIHEARFHGADVVPLQVAMLDQHRMESLFDRIESLGMLAMLEVRTPAEAEIAVALGARLIGVNARRLGGVEINRAAFAEIVPLLPAENIRVAMSGVSSPAELLSYAAAGADAVVIGERLMTSDTPGSLTRTLVATGQHPSCPGRRPPESHIA